MREGGREESISLHKSWTFKVKDKRSSHSGPPWNNIAIFGCFAGGVFTRGRLCVDMYEEDTLFIHHLSALPHHFAMQKALAPQEQQPKHQCVNSLGAKNTGHLTWVLAHHLIILTKKPGVTMFRVLITAKFCGWQLFPSLTKWQLSGDSRSLHWQCVRHNPLSYFKPIFLICESFTATSFSGISRYQNSPVWDTREYPQQPERVCPAHPEPKPNRPNLLPGFSPPQCQPAHGRSRQESPDGWLAVGSHHGPRQWTGELVSSYGAFAKYPRKILIWNCLYFAECSPMALAS